MKRISLLTITALVIFCFGFAGTSHAYSLLSDWFGVTLTTGTVAGYANQFTNSWEPTLHTGTAQYAVDNYRRYWNGTSYVVGHQPSGGESYDVEAIYFGHTGSDIYLAIVTSWPYTGMLYNGDLIVPGDIAIGLNGDVYDYGSQVAENLVYDLSGNVTSFTLGNGKVYDTQVGDWFVGNPNNDISGTGTELTNFAGGTYEGLPSYFAYYQYDFGSNNDVKDNGKPTYVLETVLSRSYLGYPSAGTPVSATWQMGCRNDWHGGQFIFRGNIVPEPTSMLLLGMGVLGVFGLRKKKT